MIVVYENCAGETEQIEVGPNILLSSIIGSCVSCVRRVSNGDNDFVYVPCA